jgi:hypothetical protein
MELTANPQMFQRKLKDYGLALAKTDRYAPFCEGIDNPDILSNTAILLSNQDTYYSQFDESTRILQVGNFDKYAFPMIRVVYPNLIANDLVSVQPMPGPTTLIFYMSIQYGTDKGKINRGDNAFDPRYGPFGSETYSTDVITGEQVIATGQQLAYFPIRPGTVKITDAGGTSTDDGAGNFVGSTTYAGTINYGSGQLSAAAGAGFTASYSYDNEANDLIPEVDIAITSAPVQAKTRKLRARYSLEAAQNLNALQGIDAEAEVVTAMSELHKQELDREVINDLRSFAAAGIVTWDRSVPAGVSYTEHKLSLVDSMVAGSNLIFAQTKRIMPNWMVIGLNVADIVETLPQFRPSAGAETTQDKTGVIKIGTLRGWDVYKDPFYPANEWLQGYKGSGMTRTGYVYAPYIPLYSTPNVILDDFISRRGTATSYGKKLVNGSFYARGQVIG